MFPRPRLPWLDTMTDLRQTPPDTGRAVRGWLGVAAVTGATFTVVTSEMLPVGLLTPMSADLRVSEGVGGLTLTITGLVAAVAAPLLTPALGRVDRKTVWAVLLTVLTVGNLAAALAPGFAVMVAARVLVGIGMGGVWSIAAGTAVRLVPESQAARATTLVFSGVAVASVLGIPAGTYAGALMGWRAAFLAAVAVGVLLLVAAAILLPPLPPVRVTGFVESLGLLRLPALRTGLIAVALLVTGHFAAYTYIRPALEQLTGAGPATVGTVLLLFGIAGVAGNFTAGATAARAPRTTLRVLAAILAAAATLTPLLGTAVPTAAALIAVWGLAYGGVSVTAQNWVFAAAPDHREASSALFVGVFNGAIAAGAFLGGVLADRLGVTASLLIGGAAAAAAALVSATGRARTAQI
ncbi:Purine ribonucleoside efflux pump nepI [Nocardia farcinica]|uniref:Purine ribonucleoside efflux pump nepI n=2 Tax=Nocardia farcinica TaxID=37329 RepID=A0A449GDU0_NOCFR|nr:Purine ribonucleoside efflux pump nepI [Nocardia farcinica]